MKEPFITVQQEQQSGIASQFYRAVSGIGGFFKPVAKIATIFQLIQRAEAVCFQAAGYYSYSDYELSCISDGVEKEILSIISRTCQNYHESDWHCPDSWLPHFTTDKYGSGFFGGAYCTLTHYYRETSSCVINIVKANIKNGVYGTTTDIWSTVGIVAGGLVVSGVLFCGSYAVIRCIRTAAHNSAMTAANERTRLMNDDGNSTAPSRLAPLPDDNEMRVIAPK